MLFVRRSLPVSLALLSAAPVACQKASKSDDTAESQDDDKKSSKKKKGDDDEEDEKSSKKKKGDDEAVKTASDDGESSKKKAKKVVEDESNPLPDSWIRVYDDKVGYEFKVPAGTPKTQFSTAKGVAYYTTQTPAPDRSRAHDLQGPDARQGSGRGAHEEARRGLGRSRREDRRSGRHGPGTTRSPTSPRR